MPTNNLINKQLPADTAIDIAHKLLDIIQQLEPYGHNLRMDERRRYGSINEKHKLLVAKIRDYRFQQPALSSPDVDWDDFELHWKSRNAYEQLEALCHSILEVCSDPRILHDFSLYRYTLVDYHYSKYRAENTASGTAFTTKVGDIRQFFPNTRRPAKEEGTAENE